MTDEELARDLDQEIRLVLSASQDGQVWHRIPNVGGRLGFCREMNLYACCTSVYDGQVWRYLTVPERVRINCPACLGCTGRYHPCDEEGAARRGRL